MERAVFHNDLVKNEIQPQIMLEKYLGLLDADIKSLLNFDAFEEAACPVTGEKSVQKSFKKFGLQYHVSKTYRNIYISPRPTMDALKTFYFNSHSRKYWINELWCQTNRVRHDKILLPQLEWCQGFMMQYLNKNKLSLAEYLPNHWGYYSCAKSLFPEYNFILIDPLFNIDDSRKNVSFNDIAKNTEDSSNDVVFLFEALERSNSPLEVLKEVYDSLKSGGLCFVTCLLSSGFEVQLLSQESDIFVPPERMNILSFEGIKRLIEEVEGFQILEFSTPGVLDIPNVKSYLEKNSESSFFQYILQERQDEELINSFQNFLQMNRLGTFGRLVLRKQ